MPFTTQLSRFMIRNPFSGHLLHSSGVLSLRRGFNAITSPTTPFRSYSRFLPSDYESKYPLHSAVYKGDVDKVVSLSNSVDINSKDSGGKTPLVVAITEGSRELTFTLLKLNASVNESDNSDSPLHLAVKRGDFEIVRVLLNCGANTEHTTYLGQTPIYNAVERADVRIVRELLRRGANPNARSNIKFPIIHEALYTGNEELVKLLINYNTNVNVVCGNQRTPLFVAITLQKPALVQMLLAVGADPNVMVNNEKPLVKAIQSNNYEVVKVLLPYLNTRRINVGAYFVSTNQTMRPLEYCVRFSDYRIVREFMQKLPTWIDLKESIYLAMEVSRADVLKLLLDREQSTNGKYSIDFTKYDPRFGIHQACRKGNSAIVFELLSRGVNPNIKDPDGLEPIHHASLAGSPPIIDELIKRGASVNNLAGTGNPIKPGFTPLFYACISAKLPIVKFLSGKGADLRAVDSDGSTLLHVSAFYGDLETIKFLIEKGLVLDQPNNNKYTPFLFSCLSGNLEVVQFFLSHGANIHQRTKSLESCIHLASAHHNIVLEFLNRGIFVDSRKDNKETPLHIAMRDGNWRVGKLLIEHGANITLENAKGKTPIEVVNPSIAYPVFNYLQENGFVKDGDMKDINPSENQNFNKTLLGAFLASVFVVTALLKK
eukprot:TRINITY_DN281_c0_g1_i1.p1 TRINITY_DN281_c0_g1~~TRINITY_DN281_c0_g1_i1.p1  ORF type:complete len:657 (-),score=95.88 TRINITY_DN281_c0_g1_i1:49-2019(-)